MKLVLRGENTALCLPCSFCGNTVTLISRLPVPARVFLKGYFKAQMIAPGEYELRDEKGVTIDCGGSHNENDDN